MEELNKIETIEQEQKETFKVTDLASANWCFKKMKALQNKKTQIQEYVDFEQKRLEEYAEKEFRYIEESFNYFKTLLQDFVETQLENDPKFKISTVDGTASFGKVQQKIKYDDSVMLDFVKNNGLDEFVKVTTTEKLNKTDFNKYLKIVDDKVITEDGEIVDSAYIETTQNFNIKLK